MRFAMLFLIPTLMMSLSLAYGAVAKKAIAVRSAAQGRNVLRNGELTSVRGGSFEEWSGYDAGYEVDSQVGHAGQASARCRNASVSERRGISQTVALDQRIPLPIVAECWSRAEGVSAGGESDYSLYLDLEYVDGTPLWGRIASFDAGTHDWQRRTVTIMPSKPVKRVTVYGLLRNRTGTAWFSDFSLRQIELAKGVAQFDGVPVEAGSRPKKLPAATVPAGLKDGFALRLAEDGSIVTNAAGGFLLRDVAANSDFVRPQGACHETRTGVGWEGRDTGLGLKLSVDYSARESSTVIRGTVQDLTGRDRAITVYFTYPVDAIGWNWYDDQRTARKMEAGGKYQNVVNIQAGANGSASRYPLACIAGENDAVAIGAPLDMPRLCRFGYDADSLELYAAIDLGLSAETARSPSSATFSLVLYRPDPAWGFRSALERYYQVFPQCFTKRNEKEGIWMPFADIAKVRDFRDFGFQFKEGDSNVPFDHEHGIYSFVYVEPMSLWLEMPKPMERTEERALAYVHERAAAGDKGAKSALSSAIEDAAGKWVGGLRVEPWCDGALYYLDPSPSVPRGPGALTKYELNWSGVDGAFKEHPDLSGTYVDSFEMAAGVRNYRREHFRNTETPLTFDTEGRVCQLGIFNTSEFAKDLATRMWGEGKMTFANAVPIDFPWGAAWFDAMGIELDWQRGGRYAPQPDADMNYYRALSYQRPYLLLLNTVYETFKPEWVELYMKRSAAYGIFPSMFSHNASDDPYWERPDLYERDRPLFKKYIPLISALSAAGWQPVTLARSSSPDIYIERFGKAGGPLYFTVFNAGDQQQQAAISFEMSESGKLAFKDVLSGKEARPDDASQLTVYLAPQDLMVLKAE